MSNFGLYATDDTSTLPVNGNVWKRTSLRYNGVKIGITSEESDNFGLRISGKNLTLNGEIIAKNTSTNAKVQPSGMFGNTDLVGHHKCINITLANYNKLLNGELVDGYKAHDPDAIYNIVSNPATAPEVFCDEPIDLSDPLYNNQPQCFIAPHRATTATFTNVNAPHISVHGYKFEFIPGEQIVVTYMVDTRTGDFANRLTRGETFTTTIRDADGNLLYENTTYAGVFNATLAPFANNGVNTTGQTWFSVECVDSHGVGSIVLYYDVLIRDVVVENLYKMQESDLEHYTIVQNDDTPSVGYYNKVGFTRLFADVAAAPENYTGILLYNPDNYTYYIDYHKNRSKVDGGFDIGSQTYYVYHKYSYQSGVDGNGKPVYKHELVTEDTQQIVEGSVVSIGNDVYTVNEDPFLFCKHDGAHLHRVGGSGSNANKIRVHWKSDPYNTIDTSIHEYVGDAFKDNGLHVFNLASKSGQYGWTTSLLNPELRAKLNDGWYYAVLDSRGRDFSGDCIVFPDNFTVDMNGAIFQGITCTDLREFCIISLDNNFDTHIRNGVVSGIYDQHNMQMFVDSSLSLGIHSTGGVFEGGRNMHISQSRFCSIENIESRYSLGYEGTVETGGLYAISEKINMNSKGYINATNGGNVQPAPLGPVDAELNPEIGNGGNIELVYTSSYIAVSADDILMRVGNMQYNCGKQHELFFTFYKQEGTTKKFISTVKTAFFSVVKRPKDATHMRITGYGMTDSNRNFVVDPTWLETGRNVPFEKLSLCKYYPSICCSYINCYWHDTRTIAFHLCDARSFLLDGCRYEHISNIHYSGGNWFVTHLLGDIEEDWRYLDNVIMKNCTATESPDWWSNGANAGTRAIGINGLQSFTFMNNTGFSYSEGTIQSCVAMNNYYCGLKITRTFRFEHPVFFYRNNIIDRAGFPPQTVTQGGFRPYETINTNLNYHTKTTHNKLTVDYPLRYNRCDDPVCVDIAMRDTFAFRTDNGTTTHDYKYHRSRLNDTIYK